MKRSRNGRVASAPAVAGGGASIDRVDRLLFCLLPCAAIDGIAFWRRFWGAAAVGAAVLSAQRRRGRVVALPTAVRHRPPGQRRARHQRPAHPHHRQPAAHLPRCASSSFSFFSLSPFFLLFSPRKLGNNSVTTG